MPPLVWDFLAANSARIEPWRKTICTLLVNQPTLLLRRTGLQSWFVFRWHRPLACVCFGLKLSLVLIRNVCSQAGGLCHLWYGTSWRQIQLESNSWRKTICTLLVDQPTLLLRRTGLQSWFVFRWHRPLACVCFGLKLSLVLIRNVCSQAGGLCHLWYGTSWRQTQLESNSGGRPFVLYW